MYILYFVLIYIATILFWLLLYYFIDKPSTLGELFKCFEGFEFVPIFNTILIVVFPIGGLLLTFLLHTDFRGIWNKIKDMKIRK